MTINWKKIKIAKPKDPIYKEGFKIYPINSLNDYKKHKSKALESAPRGRCDSNLNKKTTAI